MDTAWIPIFVLTFAECTAPSGKTVCQEHEFELQFLSQSSCEQALEQLVAARDALDNVIVDRERSRCVATATRQTVYSSLAEVSASLDESQVWQEPESGAASPDSRRASHQARLDSLPTCEDSKGVAPCKIGEIIIEGASAPKKTDVWRRDD